LLEYGLTKNSRANLVGFKFVKMLNEKLS